MALAVLLGLEGQAHASGQSGLVVAMMAIPAAVAFFFGVLGFGLLLVEKKHRGLYVGLSVVCVIVAKIVSGWLPAFVAALVAFLPVLLALHDRGGWTAVIIALVVAPVLFWSFGYLLMFTLASNAWLLPMVEALPLVPFAAACWQCGKKKLALASLPAFIALSYLFMFWFVITVR